MDVTKSDVAEWDFSAEGVADVLAKTGAKSIKAFLGLNSSDWSLPIHQQHLQP